MELKQFTEKANQILFSGSISKLFFSYKGVIGRVPYITAVFLLWIITKLCIFGMMSYILTMILLIYCLTAIIQKRARSFGSSGTWYILANLLFLYVITLTFATSEAFFPAVKLPKLIAACIATVALSILAFKPSKPNVDEQKRSFLTRFPVVYTILVFAGIFGVFELKDKYMPDTYRPSFHLGLAIGEIYRHTYGYPAFCRAQGYEMVNYPNKVREKYREEIEIAENDQMALLAKAAPDENYKDIQDFYNSDNWGTPEEVSDAVSDFFEKLRIRLIALEVAKEQNIDAKDVKLSEEDDARVSLKDACKVVDEDADYFVSSDCHFRYILNYAGKYSNCGTYFNTKGQE